MDRWVALNLYVGHVGQRSFPMTEEEYVAKLDSVAFMLSSWRQAAFVRSFFAEPPIPRRGLPSRPRVDTARTARPGCAARAGWCLVGLTCLPAVTLQAVSLRLNSSPTWDPSLLDGFFIEDEGLLPAGEEMPASSVSS